MRLAVSLTTVLLTASLAHAGDIPAPEGKTLVGPNSKLELLFTRSAKI